MTIVRHRLLVVCLSGAGMIGLLHDYSRAQPASMSPSTSAPSAQPGMAANRVGQPPTPAGQGATQAGGAGVSSDPVIPVGRGDYTYVPEGRRDPFQAMLALPGAQGSAPTAESNQPPLQRVTVAELTVIGIVWGGFGYMAMVQTPDGNGYAVQRGARIGNNNGIVSAITEKAIIVEERTTDIYGKKQVREYAKPLHVKESLP